MTEQVPNQAPIEEGAEHLQQPEYQHLDLSTPEATEALAQAPIYEKKGVVHARPATPGEKIVTVLADGTEETTNVAGENQVVITNPGGEQYIIGAEKFASRYGATDEEGVFKAKGMARAVQNPTGGPIEIMAPWGEPQYGDAECMVATVYDPDQPDVVSDDRYIIGHQEFEDTYGLVEVQPVPSQHPAETV